MLVGFERRCTVCNYGVDAAELFVGTVDPFCDLFFDANVDGRADGLGPVCGLERGEFISRHGPGTVGYIGALGEEGLNDGLSNTSRAA